MGNVALPWSQPLKYKALALVYIWNADIGSSRKAEIRIK